tara:strand:- start:15883 stop:16263 length:381 start_codon:yes stop_codon:yes gene_type:complete
MYSNNPTMTEQIEISEIIQTLNDIVEKGTVYIYRTTLSDEASNGEMYRGIVLCKKKTDSIPGAYEGGEFPGDSILVWGNPMGSNVDFPNIEFIAKMTCMTIATLLTLQGIEVYVQNKLFVPEKGVA